MKLSPSAKKLFLNSKQVRGGQTRFLENAIEYFCSGPLMVEQKLERIEFLVLRLAREQGVELNVLPKEDEEALQHVRRKLFRGTYEKENQC
ncbi:hypothetical protein CHH67_24725 [Paenibacillus campinasensis]|uniref:Uncharacterized protein n=1 Tax=Paenibacillus campinasensis TaxID=66347 RepID=A0A268EE03_9BACL|nr:hypothetical protein CHH67_24725 [Paenibacillus campinasensis]